MRAPDAKLRLPSVERTSSGGYQCSWYSARAPVAGQKRVSSVTYRCSCYLSLLFEALVPLRRSSQFGLTPAICLSPRVAGSNSRRPCEGVAVLGAGGMFAALRFPLTVGRHSGRITTLKPQDSRRKLIYWRERFNENVMPIETLKAVRSL
jgi:hypothetical protein